MGSPRAQGFLVSVIRSDPGAGSVDRAGGARAPDSTHPDVLADPEYRRVKRRGYGGYRTLLGVPMLREDV